MKTMIRPLTDEEYASLKQDIGERGIVVPVIQDPAGNIIDGAHRTKIAKELNIDCPIKVVTGTPATLKAMAIMLNVARRQLNQEDKNTLIDLLRAEGKSTPIIASLVGMTQSGVVKNINRRYDKSYPATTLGRDGKTYPAQKSNPEPIRTAVSLSTDFSRLERKVELFLEENVDDIDIAVLQESVEICLRTLRKLEQVLSGPRKPSLKVVK